MQLSVKGKQIDVGDALRQHVEEKLGDAVKKFFNHPLDANVTFSREGHMFRADITVHAGRGITLQSNSTAGEPYPAFDQAAERIAERLRRHKNRLKRHHQEPIDIEAIQAQSFVLNAKQEDSVPEGADNPLVIAEMKTTIEVLTVSEAVMRLDLGDLPALLFRDRTSNELNMIYRRADGNIGWVDPAAAN